MFGTWDLGPGHLWVMIKTSPVTPAFGVLQVYGQFAKVFPKWQATLFI